MTTYPPPYATAPPAESKPGLYPSVGADPAQPQQPSVAYHAQPAGAPGYYPGPQQPQQQQIYVGQPPATVIVQPAPPVQSFVAHIVFSCFVFWCCGCLCGLIAFICAMVAHSQARTSPGSARSCGIASIVLSVLGVVTGIIIIILVIVYVAVGFGVAASLASESAKCINNQCYEHVKAMHNERSCEYTYSGYYSNGHCYYN